MGVSDPFVHATTFLDQVPERDEPTEGVWQWRERVSKLVRARAADHLTHVLTNLHKR